MDRKIQLWKWYMCTMCIYDDINIHIYISQIQGYILFIYFLWPEKAINILNFLFWSVFGHILSIANWKIPWIPYSLRLHRRQNSFRFIPKLRQGDKKTDDFKKLRRYITYITHIPHTLPETNGLPLKMDGWKMSFLLGFGLFSGAMLVSGRVIPFSSN